MMARSFLSFKTASTSPLYVCPFAIVTSIFFALLITWELVKIAPLGSITHPVPDDTPSSNCASIATIAGVILS